MNPQLEDYIKQARVNGMTDEQIRQELLSAGWGPEDINRVLGLSQKSVSTSYTSQNKTFKALFKESFSILKSRFGSLSILFLIPLLLDFAPFSSNRVLDAIPHYFLTYYVYFVAAILISQSQSLYNALKNSFKLLKSYIVIFVLAIFTIAGGLIAGIIPGILFIIWFIPLIFIVANKEGKGFDAMVKSKNLVQGSHFFSRLFQLGLTLGLISILLVTLLIVLFLMFPVENFITDVSLITSSIQDFMRFMGSFSVPIILVFVLMIFFKSIISPAWWLVFVYILYRDLKAEKGISDVSGDKWLKRFKIFTWIGFVVVLLYSTISIISPRF